MRVAGELWIVDSTMDMAVWIQVVQPTPSLSLLFASCRASRGYSSTIRPQRSPLMSDHDDPHDYKESVFKYRKIRYWRVSIRVPDLESCNWRTARGMLERQLHSSIISDIHTRIFRLSSVFFGGCKSDHLSYFWHLYTLKTQNLSTSPSDYPFFNVTTGDYRCCPP